MLNYLFMRSKRFIYNFKYDKHVFDKHSKLDIYFK